MKPAARGVFPLQRSCASGRHHGGPDPTCGRLGWCGAPVWTYCQHSETLQIFTDSAYRQHRSHKNLLEFNKQSLRSFRQHLTVALDTLQKEILAHESGHAGAAVSEPCGVISNVSINIRGSEEATDHAAAKPTDEMQLLRSQDSRCVRVAWALRQVESLAHHLRSRPCTLPRL